MTQQRRRPSKPYTWAGGAKLTWELVCQLRRRRYISLVEYARLAAENHVCVETIQRAHSGRSWGTVRTTRMQEEYKHCVYCGTRYGRRFESGRWRSDVLWAQKETCSKSCAERLKWKRGVYANR